MPSKNICKFVTPALPHTLTVECFVQESDPTVYARPQPMVTHRAVLAVSGEGMFVLDGHPLPFRSGTLLFVFQGERFHIESEGELTYLYIGFEGGRAEELFRRFDLRRTNRYFDGFDGLIPLWCESLSRASEQTVDLAAESVLLYTFSRLAGTVKERSEVVERMLALTEERFTDPDLSLSSLAEELSYNAKYLSHLFKEKLGTSYSDYLRTLRIKYAVSLFDHGIESVKNVALLSGFSDPLYFSTIFKRHTGRSPSDYRAGLDAHDGENGT